MWSTKLSLVVNYLQGMARTDNAYLLPLRLFIGIGWLRAGLEKLFEPGWLDGTALASFLGDQLNAGQVFFPFYRGWIENSFIPGANGLSWIIIAGQLLVGMAILSGTLTNFALLWGLFMNINFILAGQVSPSAFYVVIQTILFLGDAGLVFGLDHFLRHKIPLRLLVARAESSVSWKWIERPVYLILSLLSLGAGMLAIPFIQDFSPHSVDDPAMIVLVLGVFAGLSSMISFLRLSDSDQVQASGAREITRPSQQHYTAK